jgi:hypothetical protein
MYETPFIDQIMVGLIKQEVTYYVVRSTCLSILVAIKNKYYSSSMYMLLLKAIPVQALSVPGG